MNKEDPYRDQAEKLRQRIEKINENPQDHSKLPPRSEMHRNKKKKTKWKLRYPLIRILVLFFILLPITIYSVYTNLNNKNHGGAEKATVDAQDFETIHYGNSKKDNKKTTKIQTLSPKENASDQTSSMNDVKQVSDTQRNAASKPASSIPSTKTPETDKNGGTQTTASPAKTIHSYKIIYHKVQPGETLYHIAMEYYHSESGMNKIIEANHLQNENIEVGQVLKILIMQ